MRELINLMEATDPDSWMDPVNRKNAEYAQTHYSQPDDDSIYNTGIHGDSAAYQNYKSRKNTAQQNKVNSGSMDAAYKATLAANTQHTSPIYSTQEEWDSWIRKGGIEYARDMDLDNLKKQKTSNFNTDYAERQAYIRLQNQLAQQKNTTK